MTKLRDEFQEIVEDAMENNRFGTNFGSVNAIRVVNEVALRIQEYIDAKEPVMLKDAEIVAAFERKGDRWLGQTAPDWLERMRKVLAAHIAKQREPQKRTVTVYVYADENGNIFATTDQKCMSPPAANLIDTIVKEYDV